MRIKYRDLAARVFDDEIRFPAFFPTVYGTEAPDADAVAVNVYRLWADKNFSSLRRKNILKMLDTPFVLPESGWQTINKYEDDDVTNEDLVELQGEMNFPIVAPLPAPKVEDAIINAKIAQEGVGRPLFLEIPRTWSKEEIEAFIEATKEFAWGYGVHSEDPNLLETTMRIAPRRVKIIVLGIHHPSIIPLLVALGVDGCTSGAYARYAQKGLYITEASIRPLSEMDELPCTCPVCTSRGPEDLERNTELLAQHNLLTFLSEIRRTRNAIREGRLYEYAKRRSLTHPNRYTLFKKIMRSRWILENLPFPKQSSIYVFDGEKRPEIRLAEHILEKTNAKKEALAYTYPFGQTYPPLLEERPIPEDVVKNVFLYQFGIKVDLSELRWEVKRGIPRKIYREETYLGLIRFEDGFFVPSIDGAKWLKRKTRPPKLRIVVDVDGVQAIRKKRSPLTNHVLDVDPELRPNMEVIIVDEGDKVIGTGKSILTAREVAEIPNHPVVKIRHRAV